MKKTPNDADQYPLGYIFGTMGYQGGISIGQVYHGNNVNGYYEQSFCIPSNLTSVSISGGCILYGAFYNCKSLISIEIDSDISLIVRGAFVGCDNLTNIKFKGTKNQWMALEKEEDWNFGALATQVVCSDGTVAI